MLRQRINESDSKLISSESTSDKTSNLLPPRNAKPLQPSSDLMDSKYGKKSRNQPVNLLKSLLKLLSCSIVIILIIVYLIIPITFKYCSPLRRHLLFMNYVNHQWSMNLSNPETEYDLNCTKVLKIPTKDGIELGVWHIFPGSLINQYCAKGSAADLTNVDESLLFKDNRPVILYSHGNGGTRGGFHRLGLYKLLSYGQTDAHIITFDYRGYGDSTNVPPSVNGVVSDAVTVYNWLTSKVDHKRINVWGHSLGTAISVGAVKQIAQDNQPNTLTLEAPFSSIYDAITEYPLAALYKFYPAFDYFFVEPFRVPENELFNTQVNIKQLSLPILILHSKDDNIVPYKLGFKLYQIVLKLMKGKPVQPKLFTFDASLGYGHKNIYKDPRLTEIYINFINHNLTQTSVEDVEDKVIKESS